MLKSEFDTAGATTLSFAMKKESDLNPLLQYEVTACVNGKSLRCTLEHTEAGWGLVAFVNANSEGWSSPLRMDLSREQAESIRYRQISGQYFSKMNLKTEGGRLSEVQEYPEDTKA